MANGKADSTEPVPDGRSQQVQTGEHTETVS
jgi:hypothetical protein